MKLKRDINSNILDQFWDLVSTSDEKRIKSGELLLTALMETQDPIKNERSKELEYVVKRLIRGLASDRECARLGYSAVLTLVLQKYHLYTVADILDLVDKLIKVVKSDSKAETSSALLGRVLAYLCIIQADMVTEVDGSQVGLLVKKILILRKRKAFLQTVCTSALTQIASKMAREAFRKSVWPQIEADVSIGWKNCSADNLYLLLSLRAHRHVDKNFLATHWNAKKIMTQSNHQHLLRILIESSSSHPIIHPVWTELLQLAIDNGRMYFASFWNDVICGGLSQQRFAVKSLCLTLASQVFDRISSTEQVETVLCRQVLSRIIHYLTSKDERLVFTCKQLLANVTRFVSQCSSGRAQLSVLHALISQPSSVLFDGITKTKTITSIISHFNAEGCRLLADYLMQVISECKSDAEPVAMETQCKWAINILSVLVTHPAMVSENVWKQNIIEFMLVGAFFSLHQSADVLLHCNGLVKATYGESVRGCMREAFWRSLNKLATFNPNKLKVSHDQMPFVDLLFHLAQFTQLLLSHPDIVVPAHPLDADAQLAWSTMLKTVNKIHNQHQESKTGFTVAFALLFIHCGLQLFIEPESACGLLQELHICYKRASSHKKRDKSSGDEPIWIDVVVDLLMSLLSQDCQLVRTIVNCAFTALIPQLSTHSLQLIVEVLKPVAETGDVLDFSDEDEDDANADHCDESEMETCENESDESSSDEETVDDEEIAEADREKVKLALGDAAAKSDDEESDLDDEAMFRLDSVLSAAFKSMKKGKKVDQVKEMQLKNYKMRCLELLELFIQHTSSPNLLIYLVMPLLDCLPKETNDLNVKIQRVLSELCHPKKMLLDTTSVNSDTVFELLTDLLQRSVKAPSIQQTECLVMAFLFIVRIHIGCARDEDKSKVSKVLNIVIAQIDNFCVKGDSPVNHMFIQRLFDRRPELLRPVMPTLIQYITSEDVRVFCRTLVCSWLTAVISKQTIEDIGIDAWNVFASEIVNKTVKVIMEAEVGEMKPKYTAHILTLLTKVISVAEDVDSIKQSLPTELTEKLLSLKKVNKDVRKACHRLMGTLHCRLQLTTTTKKEMDKKKNGTEINNEVVTKKRKINNSDRVVKEKTSKKRRKESAAN